jgi:mono/diheme cytochrome c family protein
MPVEDIWRMTRTPHAWTWTLAALTLSLPAQEMPARSAAPGGTDASTIEIWVRKPGATPVARDGVQVVNIDTLPLVEAKRIDVQYHGAFTYRGIDIQSLIARYHPPAGADLALLHFANGMQVPLPVAQAASTGGVSPFLARAMRLGPHGPMRVGRFPNISRPRSGFVDVRPIVFAGNKLVVAEEGHPDVPPQAQGVLSPWQQVDSLTGIELVSRAAYYAQFDVDPEARPGHKLFTQSCQFCHGVRRVGAAFGWDFVEPTPIYDYRGERNLFHHIKYKPLDASARGLQMPALSYMTEDDARAIWLWLKAVGTKPLRPYAP